jgi:predicted phosphodiesterase
MGATMQQVAILSDVHGNMTAYEAVLADVDARGVDRVFNLGDIFGKGPNGSAAVRVTRERCEATVYGNWDVLVHKPREVCWPPLSCWLDEMSADDLAWIGGLPFSIDIILGECAVRMFHASSDSVFHRIHRRHSDEDFLSMFASTEAVGDGPVPDIVVYGDIHSAYIKHSGGKTLVNAGSVGNPLDEPTASYAILSTSDAGHGIGAEIVRVTYDIEREIAIAAERGMPELDEYAIELRTSVYRGLRKPARK